MINKKTPIKIYSPNIDLLGEIDDYTSFIITRKYNETGDFSLYINFDKLNAKYLLQKNNIVMVHGSSDKNDKAGIIKHAEITLDEEGNEIIIAKGFTLDVILNQREIELQQNEEESVFIGKNTELIEKLVLENLVNPTNSKRKINNLINSSNSEGTDIAWKLVPTTKVGNEISDIAILDGLGYKIYLDLLNKKLVFTTYQGKDLSRDQSVNPKVVFSPSFNNIRAMKYIKSSIDEKNVVYIRLKNSNFAIPYGEAEGINRQETHLDYAELQVNETFEDVGRQELSRYPEVESIEGEVLTNAFFYEKDYNLGDIVTVENSKWGISKSLRITSISEIYEEKPRITVVFGDPLPTFIKKIRNYITNMK